MKSIISFSSKGDFSKTTKFFNKVLQRDYASILSKYGRMGVEALSAATPVRTGKTSESWYYKIENDSGTIKINWYNSNIVYGNENVSVALLIQYGHGTRNGGYVEGYDYINPAIKPVFDEILDKVWKEVESL